MRLFLSYHITERFLRINRLGSLRAYYDRRSNGTSGVIFTKRNRARQPLAAVEYTGE
jgi:hypothetical protein